MRDTRPERAATLIDHPDAAPVGPQQIPPHIGDQVHEQARILLLPDLSRVLENNAGNSNLFQMEDHRFCLFWQTSIRIPLQYSKPARQPVENRDYRLAIRMLPF